MNFYAFPKKKKKPTTFQHFVYLKKTCLYVHQLIETVVVGNSIIVFIEFICD